MGNIDELYDRDKRAVLGGGTYATVYAARCRRTGQQVALKKLRQMAPPHGASTPATTERFSGRECTVSAAAKAPPLPLLSNGLSSPPFTFHTGEPTSGQGGSVAAATDKDAANIRDSALAVAVTERGCAADYERGSLSQAAVREIEVLQELKHPNIIRLRETFVHKKTLVLVFDYAAGGDLELLLYPPTDNNSTSGGRDHRGGASSLFGSVAGGAAPATSAHHTDGGGARTSPPVPAGVVKAHMLALLEALAYCHEQGVLHRDVKPNNMLLDGGGRLLLADFGLARYLPREPEEEEIGRAVERENAQATGTALQEAVDKGGPAGEVCRQHRECSNAVGNDGCGGCKGVGVEEGKIKRRAGGLGEAVGSGGEEPLGHFAADHEVNPPADVYARPVMTHQVGMRWYRPPELLFGCRTYGTGVDIWAAGCIFAEMMLRRVWFKGNSDVEQLRLIFEVMGTPTEEIWPGVTQLPNYLNFAPMQPRDLSTIFSGAAPHALDLLTQLTCLCPEKRPTARQALSHPYFSSEPAPTLPGQLPLAVTRVAAAAARANGVAPQCNGSSFSHVGMEALMATAGGNEGGISRGAGARRREEGNLGAALGTFATDLLMGSSGGASLPMFQLPLPMLPQGRLPAVHMSLDAANAAAAAGSGAHRTALSSQFFRSAKRPGLKLSELEPSCVQLPAPGSSCTGNGPVWPVSRVAACMTQGLHAAEEGDVARFSGGEAAVNRVSAVANSFDGAGAPMMQSALSEVGASAPRRHRHGRRTRCSGIMVDTSVSAMSVKAVRADGGTAPPGRLWFDEVVGYGAAAGVQVVTDGNGAGVDHQDDMSMYEGVELEGAEAEHSEDGDGDAQEDMEEGLDEEEEEEDDEDDFDGFRRCVARRFSFGSSLVTGGEGAATTVNADAAAMPPPGSGGAMAVTVASDDVGGTAQQRGSDSTAGGGGGACCGDGVVPMVTTTATTVGGSGGVFDSMCISDSMCGGGGGVGGGAGAGGSGTVGSKRRRSLRDAARRQSQPPTPAASAAALAAADHTACRATVRSLSLQQQALRGYGDRGGNDSVGVNALMQGSVAGNFDNIQINCNNAIASAMAVATMPSISMASVGGRLSSVNGAAVAGPGGNGGGDAADRLAMEVSELPPHARSRHSRQSSASVAMSLSFAGGIDAVAAVHTGSSAPVPPTVVGPRLPNGIDVVQEQASTRGSRVVAVGCGGTTAAATAVTENGSGMATATAAHPPDPALLLLPHGPSMGADAGKMATAIAATVVVGDGGGCDVTGSGGSNGDAVMVAEEPLSGSMFLRLSSSGLRHDSTDLQYLRQRKAEVDEALRQASQVDEPQGLDNISQCPSQHPKHHQNQQPLKEEQEEQMLPSRPLT